MITQVDPLAYQFYKSLVCFSTSWLVLTYNPFRFTWWGTVGATIWVANGVMAIMAIQKAGLGIAQTTWSALSIFVSFIWGAFVFHEPIKSLPLSFVGELPFTEVRFCSFDMLHTTDVLTRSEIAVVRA